MNVLVRFVPDHFHTLTLELIRDVPVLFKLFISQLVRDIIHNN